MRICRSWGIEQNILKLVILGHFLPFYGLKTPKNKILKNDKICCRYHFTHVYQKSQSYDVPFLRYGVREVEFFVILGHILPFYYPPSPTNDLENQNFDKKWKKKPGDIIILHRCTINNSYMVYGSWDIKHNGQNFLSFWTPLTTQKNENKSLKIL